MKTTSDSESKSQGNIPKTKKSKELTDEQHKKKILYKNQLQIAENQKNTKAKQYKDLRNEIYSKELKLVINFDSDSQWERNLFDYEMIFREDTPLIKDTWEEANIEQSSQGADVGGYIFRPHQTLNMENLSVEMSISCYLAGESTCWIFSRVLNYFDEYSLIIKIEKLENNQKVFVSYGTFVRDSQNNLIFKAFIKEQLIDFSKNINTFYTDNDICLVKILLLDSCDDIALSRIYLNDSKTENKVVLNFLLPMRERRKIMIAGNGEKCLIKKFMARNVDLRRKNTGFLNTSLKNMNISINKDKSNDVKNEKNLKDRGGECGCSIF